jgi:hypothetical protein
MARWIRLGGVVALAFALAGPASAVEPAMAPESPPAASSDSQAKQAVEPGKFPHQCPKSAYLNCMPPVSAELRPFCHRDYIEWAKSHCPHFEVVY